MNCFPSLWLASRFVVSLVVLCPEPLLAHVMACWPIVSAELVKQFYFYMLFETSLVQSTFRIIEALICNENTLAVLYPQKKIMKGLCSQGNLLRIQYSECVFITYQCLNNTELKSTE